MEENKKHQDDLERKVFGLSMLLAKQLKEEQKLADPDYWTRLEHQYAGMAMQGMLSGWWTENIAKISYNDGEHFNLLTHKAKELAHALVEKMKEAFKIECK